MSKEIWWYCMDWTHIKIAIVDSKGLIIEVTMIDTDTI